MVLSEISTAVSALKTAIQITKTFFSITKDADIHHNAIELQNIIMSIQSSMLDLQAKYYELLKSKDDIEKELITIKNWNVTQSQYDLIEIKSGVFVYIPNENHKSPKPIHYLCTNCFQNHKKSFLQIKKKYSTGFGDFYCPLCNMEISFHPKP